MNRYPSWAYALIALAIALAFLYTLPNFFGEAPAVQVSSAKSTVKVDSALLGKVKGVQISELAETEACCGFGGTFCVKFPDISNSMVERKTADIAASGADTVLAGDLGCLMNIAGKLKREGSSVKVRHVAEVLAGMTDDAAIGDAE